MQPNSSPQRIALYGGSFDPIHFGHLISARAIAERLQMTRVILIPSGRPPHKTGRSITPGHHRLAMTHLAVEGDPLFEVSDFELHRSGPSYSLETVRQFRETLPTGAELFWIIGRDSLPELATWHRAVELVDSVRFVTATRPGGSVPDLTALRNVLGPDRTDRLVADCCDTPAIEISATNIRARVAAGLSVRYLLPDRVITYVESEGLYRS